MKAYFNIAALINDTAPNNGNTVKLELTTIKVGGVEQLTTDFFTEIIPAFVNPRTGNNWEFANCTQTGIYPNVTSIASCSIFGINSFNPFANAFGMNYSNIVGGVKRGEMTTSLTSSVYGIEQFKFGFDTIDTPINDLLGNGSSGSVVQGAFYLDIDYTQDFEMVLNTIIKNSDGAVLSDKTHTYTHSNGNCDFDYTVQDNLYNFVSISNFGATTLQAANLSFVDGGNGFMYSSPARSGFFLRLEKATNQLVQFGTFTAGVAVQYGEGVLAPNGKIYFMPISQKNVLVLDVATETYTTIGSTVYEARKPIVTSNGLIYAASNNESTFLKVDTNTNTVTELSPSVFSGGGRFVDLNNGYLYLISSIADSVYKLDLANDTLVDLNFVGFHSISNDLTITDVDSNGFIYCLSLFYSAPDYKYRVNKIDTSNDTFTVIDVGLDDNVQMYSIQQLPDLNIVAIGNTNEVIKIDTTNNIKSVYVSQNVSMYGATLTGNSLYITPLNADSFTQITFSYSDLLNTKEVSFLSGGLSGWITPDCVAIIVGTCDPIVTQSICFLAQSPQTPAAIFGDLEGCCYISPVFGHLTENDEWKNDFNSFLLKRNFTSETIALVLQKNGVIDLPLIDNTYGTYYNFGSLVDYPNYKGYQIEWQKVLQVEGEGNYRLKATSALISGTIIEYSIPFQLKGYTEQLASGTVRLQSVMNGYLRHRDFNFKGLNWIDGLRVRGFFGNRQAEYEQEQIIYTNRQSKQLRSEMINNYTLQTMHIPSCITDAIIEYHNFANSLYITDYNRINHKDYVQKEVVFDSLESIEYKSVSKYAPLQIKYKDLLQNYLKSNC